MVWSAESQAHILSTWLRLSSSLNPDSTPWAGHHVLTFCVPLLPVFLHWFALIRSSRAMLNTTPGTPCHAYDVLLYISTERTAPGVPLFGAPPIPLYSLNVAPCRDTTRWRSGCLLARQSVRRLLVLLWSFAPARAGPSPVPCSWVLDP